MARTYNKVDYFDIITDDMSVDDLRKLIRNMAATINARHKSVTSLSGAEEVFAKRSDSEKMYNRLMSSNPEYFTSGGALKKTYGKIKDKDELVKIADAYLDTIAIIEGSPKTAARKHLKNLADAISKQTDATSEEILTALESPEVQKELEKMVNAVDSKNFFTNKYEQYENYDHDMAVAAGSVYKRTKSAVALDVLLKMGLKITD